MALFKIAIHNPFFGENVAETELAERMIRALNKLGHEGFIVFRLEDLRNIQPDFVLALHPNAPKISEFTTYGCMWNPPEFSLNNHEMKKNIQSYDGYLYGCHAIQDWVSDLLLFREKSYNLADLLPTTNAARFAASAKL